METFFPLKREILKFKGDENKQKCANLTGFWDDNQACQIGPKMCSTRHFQLTFQHIIALEPKGTHILICGKVPNLGQT